MLLEFEGFSAAILYCIIAEGVCMRTGESPIRTISHVSHIIIMRKINDYYQKLFDSKIKDAVPQCTMS